MENPQYFSNITNSHKIRQHYKRKIVPLMFHAFVVGHIPEKTVDLRKQQQQ